MMKPSIFFIFVIALSTLAFSQDITPYTLRSQYGVFGNYNFNHHVADFRGLPGVPTCCPNFGSGNGQSITAGLLYQHPLTRQFFLSGRLGYYSKDGTLTTVENTPETTVQDQNGNAVPGVLEHRIDAVIGSIGFEPIFGYRIWEDLSIMAGLHGGYIIHQQFTQTEKISSPSTGTFENGQRSRLDTNGEIVSHNDLEFAVLGGLSYDFPLTGDRRFMLSPEIFYSYSILPIINSNKFPDRIDSKESNWSVNSIRVGISLKYLPYVLEPHPTLEADVNAYGLDEDMNEEPVAKLKVEEFLSTRMRPLLTYVFFDDNSSELPEKYKVLTKEKASVFFIDSLYHLGVLDTYYNLLNIIGRRMKDYPDARIAIDGCNNGVGAEKNNLDLSKRRARTLRDYLIDVWNIEPDRILISQRNLPQEPSNPNDPDGIEENRRAEITTNKWEIIAPLIVNDTFRMVNPPVVRFKNKLSSDVGVSQWKLAALYHGNPLVNFDGKEKVPDMVDWKFQSRESAIPRNEGFDYQFLVQDKTGQIYETPVKNLPVEQVTIQKKQREQVKDKYIDRFSLILFQFDKSDLGIFNKKVIDLIKSRMKPSSTVKISGHTDRMGQDDYNKKLSYDRAKAVADALGTKRTTVKGLGEKEQLYNNDLPEGRFYCRKVDIVVETPIEDVNK